MHYKKSILLATTVVGILFMWYVLGVLSPYFFKGLNDSALYGDSFGAVNALFSGLAFAGIIYTILQQQEEMYLQRFESTFFNMLNILNNVATSMEVKRHQFNLQGKTIDEDEFDLHGVQCFAMMQKFSSLKEKFSIDHFQLGEGYSPYTNPFELFSQYNTSLTLILQFIDDSKLMEDEKRRFFSMVIEPMTFYQKCTFIYHIALCYKDVPINGKLKELERRRRLFSNPFPTDLKWAAQMNRSIFYEIGILDPKDDPYKPTPQPPPAIRYRSGTVNLSS